MSFFGIELNVQISRLMFDIRLHLAKNKYKPNLRTLYRSFLNFDPECTGLVSGVGFEKGLNANGIFMKKYDIQLFQKFYHQNEKINWRNFLNHLKEPMAPSRRQLVEKIFNSMDSQQAQKISTQDLMSHFNYSQIESFRLGKNSQEQIASQFLQMLHVQDGFITREEFMNFYDDLNLNFGHNEIFFSYVSAQWFYTPQKIQEVKQQEIKKYILMLRNKLLQRTQGSKDELLALKLFKEFDLNGNSCLSAYDLDLMLKKVGVVVDPRIVEPMLSKIDKNQSGYIEFEQFKKFLYHHPYPY